MNRPHILAWSNMKQKKKGFSFNLNPAEQCDTFWEIKMDGSGFERFPLNYRQSKMKNENG